MPMTNQFHSYIYMPLFKNVFIYLNKMLLCKRWKKCMADICALLGVFLAQWCVKGQSSSLKTNCWQKYSSITRDLPDSVIYRYIFNKCRIYTQRYKIVCRYAGSQMLLNILPENYKKENKSAVSTKLVKYFILYNFHAICPIPTDFQAYQQMNYHHRGIWRRWLGIGFNRFMPIDYTRVIKADNH